MVKVKTGIGWVAVLVSDRGSETGVHSLLPGTGGHPDGYCQHCQKFRTQGHSQVDAEQVIHPFFFKVGFFFLSFHSFFLLSIVSGVNSGSVSTDPPRSPSKTLPICLLSSPIQLSISVLSDCVPTTSWRLSTPVSKRMRSKGSRLTSS